MGEEEAVTGVVTDGIRQFRTALRRATVDAEQDRHEVCVGGEGGEEGAMAQRQPR